MDFGMLLLGFGFGIMFCKAIDKLQSKAETAIDDELVRQCCLEAVDKVKEEIEKEK